METTTEEMTMQQMVNAGMAFDPLETTGRAFIGRTQNALMELTTQRGLQDRRWIVAENAKAAGFKLAKDAELIRLPVKQSNGTWAEMDIVHASQVRGLPTLAKMLEVGEKQQEWRAANSAEITIAPAPSCVQSLTPVEEETIIKRGKEKEAIEQLPLPAQKFTTQRVLGTVFTERVAGTGEYFREGACKPAVVDKGESLVIREKTGEGFQAAMELAKAKGWNAIEICGKPAQVQQAWLEAALVGVRVSNYVPTEKDMDDLDSRLATLNLPACDRDAVQGLGPVPDGATRAQAGQYVGAVVAVENGYVIQDAGRGNYVAHRAAEFSPALQVGQMLDVKYREGRAQVQATQQREREGRGR